MPNIPSPLSHSVLSPEVLAIGEEMHAWASDLFPLPRSLTGDGVRQTLQYLQGLVPALQIHEVPSGTQAFDWTVPDEWTIRDAYIANEHGERVVDFKAHTLSVVGYSEPIDTWLSREELEAHLYSDPNQPTIIPYVTSYYKRRWGFCLPHKKREALPAGHYHVVVDATLAPGALTYGEVLLPGEEEKEILFSTYVCHPSMANNELSGPVMATALIRWLQALPRRRFSYRFVFAPETIGSLVYLSQHLTHLQKNVVAGFVLTCVGDERAWSFMPSRRGATVADRVALHVLKHAVPGYKAYSFLERGSDERQYCSPRVNLPIVSIMRSKYGEYPEYHTSADDLSLITARGLAQTFDVYTQCLQVLEHNYTYKATCYGEPQMGKRGLYPTVSYAGSAAAVRDMMNVLAYADGTVDLIGLAEDINVPSTTVIPLVNTLVEHGLLRIEN